MAQLPPQAAALITRLQRQVQVQAREIAWRDAKLEKVNFELARLKCAFQRSRTLVSR
jgi:transposase